MYKKLLVILLAVVLILSFNIITVIADGESNSSSYLNPAQANVFNLPIRYKTNQSSSENPATEIHFECTSKLYYENPDDDSPLSEPDVTFPVVTVSDITFNKGVATPSGAVENAEFNIPATLKTGIYEYRYSVTADHDAVLIGDDNFALKVYVFNTASGKQMAVSTSVPREGSTVDPSTGNPVLEMLKVDELVIEYKAYEYSVAKNVAGNLGDRDKYFDFTATFTGAAGINYANATTVTVSGGSHSSNPATVDIRSGSATVNFKLKHGEKVTFANIPKGFTITTTESEYTDDEYVTTINNEEKRTESYTIQDPVQVVDPLTNEVVNQYGNGSVTVTNTKNGTVDVGVTVENLPYIVAAVIVIICVILLIIVKKHRKRRMEDEEET